MSKASFFKSGFLVLTPLISHFHILNKQLPTSSRTTTSILEVDYFFRRICWKQRYHKKHHTGHFDLFESYNGYNFQRFDILPLDVTTFYYFKICNILPTFTFERVSVLWKFLVLLRSITKVILTPRISSVFFCLLSKF